jgi:hypothetical protein
LADFPKITPEISNIYRLTKHCMKKLTLTLVWGLVTLTALSQAPKFGKVTADELKVTSYPVDSTAEAVVLADYGKAEIEGNSKGWFSIVYKRYRKVHILKKSGYRHADVVFDLYKNGNIEEQMNKLNAVTYNLEDGKVVQTKVEKSSVFNEKKSRYRTSRKFTFPNVKEGSIIEYETQVTSDFLSQIDPWNFQAEIPVLYSEFHAFIPQFLYYMAETQGFQNLEKDQKNDVKGFVVLDAEGTGRTEAVRFDAGVTEYIWTMKNVPALKIESFATTPKNYISQVKFKLSAYRPPLTYRNLVKPWTETTASLMTDEYFGKELAESHKWLGEVMKEMGSAANDEEKAKKIFAYVRDHFTCTERNDIFVEQSLKNLLKTRSGGVAEINMLLTAMLRYAGFQADPVILSTREHGYANNLYPNLEDYNYVVTQAKVGEKTFVLDASIPRLGFGKLSAECYNGTGRIINETANLLPLHPDSLQERSVSFIMLTNDAKGRWVGNARHLMGYYESYKTRNRMKEKTKDEFVKETQKSLGAGITISNFTLDSLDQYDNPVQMSYNLQLENPEEDILYIDPMFGQGYKENPFKSEERLYPVEMPYVFDQTYLLTMEVPNGYVVDEMPKSMIVKLNDQNDGIFEYRITQSGTSISMHSKVKFKRAVFQPEEYEMLRGFFSYIVSKHNEQIVLKKKK